MHVVKVRSESRRENMNPSSKNTSAIRICNTNRKARAPKYTYISVFATVFTP